MSRSSSPATICLLVLIAALLLLGLAGGTLFRHVIQAIAPAVAILALRRDAVLGGYAALPIFIFWFAAVTRVLLGDPSSAETVLSIVIVAASLVGLFSFIRNRPSTPLGPAFRTAIAFALVQLFSLFLSFHPLISGN